MSQFSSASLVSRGERVVPRYWVPRREIHRHLRWAFELRVLEPEPGRLLIQDRGRLALRGPVLALAAAVFFLWCAFLGVVGASIQTVIWSIHPGFWIVLGAAALVMLACIRWVVSRVRAKRELQIDLRAGTVSLRDDRLSPSVLTIPLDQMRIVRCDLVCVGRDLRPLLCYAGVCIVVGERLFLLCSCKRQARAELYESSLPREVVRRFEQERCLIWFNSDL